MRFLLLITLALLASVGFAQDEHSYAQYKQVKITDLYWDVAVSFDKKTVAGFAELSLAWQNKTAQDVDLDTRDLTIDKVFALTEEANWQQAAFTLHKSDATKGARLQIKTNKQPSKLRVYYRSSPSASGLQWLTADQTMSKKHPFMFSQAQAIHARSFIPLQDTPAVRFTFRARVQAPDGLRVVMGADNNPQADGKGGYFFNMPQAIPSYLFAIAVGELDYQSIGPRSGVYAEPARLQAAAAEFADTEKMIVAAEKLFGEYRWGVYDLLILPPSFPFGGMENPRLSFITPTVIAGDKSLVSLIAHELAHSWSGNLVTNNAWKHLWLNEGFTSYVENRISEEVYGAELAQMAQTIAQDELLVEIKDMPAGDQWLVPALDGRDPDDVFSGVPYDKGAWLLLTLEQTFGREKFDLFLRGWFDSQAFKSVSTDDFLLYLQKNLFDKYAGKMHAEEIDQWMHSAGIPKRAKKTPSPRLAQIEAQRDQLVAGKISASELNAKTWVTQEWLHFLNGIPADLPLDKIVALDKAWKLTGAGNAEIAFRWYLIGIRGNYPAIESAMEKHLIGIGRRKLIVPLYEELAKTEKNLAWAKSVYAKAKSGYHPIAQSSVEQKLGMAK